MSEQKISKNEAKREFRELAKNKIKDIISNSSNLEEQKDIRGFWNYLRLIEGDADYPAYLDLYTGFSDYVADVNLISPEELSNLLNKIVYLENNKKNGSLGRLFVISFSFCF